MKYSISIVGIVLMALLGGCGGQTIGGAMVSNAMHKSVFGAQEMPERCQGIEWSKSDMTRLDCIYPPPPQGRWKAVYTKDFALKYNLPLDGVSTDLSPGVDYMEIETLPYGTNFKDTACMVNMLVKKPHSIVLYGKGFYLLSLPRERKLLNLINIQKYQKSLKPVNNFYPSSRDYVFDKKGFSLSTVAMYAPDVLPEYDYFSSNANCKSISSHPQYFPDGYAFRVFMKDSQGFEKNNGKHAFINIPYELVSTIFDNVTIGGK
jgi:hypothetical protein